MKPYAEMSGAERERDYKRSCLNKIRHDNEEDAARACFGRLAPYKCRHCSSWHVGHRFMSESSRPRNDIASPEHREIQPPDRGD